MGRLAKSLTFACALSAMAVFSACGHGEDVKTFNYWIGDEKYIRCLCTS